MVTTKTVTPGKKPSFQHVSGWNLLNTSTDKGVTSMDPGQKHAGMTLFSSLGGRMPQ